jgi:hypothetical protein
MAVWRMGKGSLSLGLTYLFLEIRQGAQACGDLVRPWGLPRARAGELLDEIGPGTWLVRDHIVSTVGNEGNLHVAAPFGAQAVSDLRKQCCKGRSIACRQEHRYSERF